MLKLLIYNSGDRGILYVQTLSLIDKTKEKKISSHNNDTIKINKYE